MDDKLSVRLTVSEQDLDVYGRLKRRAYLRFAEHARFECLRAAGILQDDLANSGVRVTVLENLMRFGAPLWGGAEVDVTCEWVWGAEQVFYINQLMVQADGTVSADLNSVGGLLDLVHGKLIANPRQHLLALADRATYLGLGSL